MKIETCFKEWSPEPRLIKGKTYKLVKETFRNGENQSHVADGNGKTFEVPSVFFWDAWDQK